MQRGLTRRFAHAIAHPPLPPGPAQALQRGLPRPAHLDGLPAPKPSLEAAALPLAQRAEELLLSELTRLLAHDAAKYPPAPAAKDK